MNSNTDTSYTAVYAYDNRGNILSKKRYAYTEEEFAEGAVKAALSSKRKKQLSYNTKRTIYSCSLLLSEVDMNNCNIEREIIKKYVKKNKQERIIYELYNPKKREYIIWKFAGTGLFKPECLKPVGYMSCKEMVDCLFEVSEAQEVYFWGESYVGVLSLKQAVELAHTGEICIIYCGKGVAYYQGEQENGRPPRFLLVTD